MSKINPINMCVKTKSLSCVFNLFDVFGGIVLTDTFNILKDKFDVFNVSSNFKQHNCNIIDKILSYDNVSQIIITPINAEY